MHITCCLSHNKSNKSQQLSVKNCQLVQKFYFLLLLRDAVQKRGHGACLDVCLSRSCIVSKIVNIMLELIHFPVVRIFWFFHTKYYGEIPTEFPLIGASNAGAVWKNRDFLPISCFVSEMIQDRNANKNHIYRTVQWPWVSHNLDFKITMFFNVKWHNTNAMWTDVLLRTDHTFTDYY